MFNRNRITVPCPRCNKLNRFLLRDYDVVTCGACKAPLRRGQLARASDAPVRHWPWSAWLQHPRLIAAVVGLALLFSFATFVWPTRWRYEDFRGIPTRTDRFTGEVQVLSTYGWYSRR